MTLRDPETVTTSSSVPMTRREARERDEAQRAAGTKALFATRAVEPRAQPAEVARKTQKAKKQRGSGLFSLGALTLAAALLVAASVPSNAFISDASALAPAVTVDARPGQTLAVSDAAVAPSSVRDGYSVTSYAEQLRQRYGNMGTYSPTTGAIRWPFPYSVPFSDGFGLRDASISGIAFHKGVDFNPGGGSPIYAIADGVVTTAVDGDVGLGTHVIIQHNIAGQNVESVYAHMRLGSSPLKVGDVIKVGDFIGLVGATGVSTGEHLHFEIHLDGVPVDPFAWLTENAVN